MAEIWIPFGCRSIHFESLSRETTYCLLRSASREGQRGMERERVSQIISFTCELKLSFTQKPSLIGADENSAVAGKDENPTSR